MAVPRSGRRNGRGGAVQTAQRGVQGEGGTGSHQGPADTQRDRRRARGASRADSPVEGAGAGGGAGAVRLQEVERGEERGGAEGQPVPADRSAQGGAGLGERKSWSCQLRPSGA